MIIVYSSSSRGTAVQLFIYLLLKTYTCAKKLKITMKINKKRTKNYI